MLTWFNMHLIKYNKEISIIKLIIKNKKMSIKSNISTLKIWLSEKVKITYEDKNQLVAKKIERNTSQILISK